MYSIQILINTVNLSYSYIYKYISVSVMKTVALISTSSLFCILNVCLGARDLTMEEYASGEVVVDATIATLDAMFLSDSSFWTEGDDSMFFKDLALVESTYGEDDDTFTMSHLGGIWQVMQTAFDDTQNLVTIRRNPEFSELLDEVSDVLDITWSTVTFDDLAKPLHSLVAARLVLHLKAASTGGDPEDICTRIPTLDNREVYGRYWYECYREEMSGSVQEFENKIDPEGQYTILLYHAIYNRNILICIYYINYFEQNI